MKLFLGISKSSPTNKQLRAYTLIELVLVVAILSILLGIAIHRFTGLGLFEAEGQLHKMENDLRMIRMESIRNRKKTAFVIEKNEYKLYIEGKIAYEDKLTDDLILVATNTNDSSHKFVFSKSGRPATCGSFIFQIGKKKKELVVAPVTGKISLRSYNEKN